MTHHPHPPTTHPSQPPNTPACSPNNPELAHLTPRARVDLWFPTVDDGANHGGDAIRICASCPQREPCLRAAVERAEPAGIWGGAGQSRRRVLRRALVEGRYGRVAAAHFRVLDGVEQPTDRFMLRSYGGGATHGRRVTYARACRCEACGLAASFETVSKGGVAA